MSLIYANCMDITLLACGVKMQVVPKSHFIRDDCYLSGIILNIILVKNITILLNNFRSSNVSFVTDPKNNFECNKIKAISNVLFPLKQRKHP